MMILIAIILIIAIVGADYIMYLKLSALIPKDKPAAPAKKEEHTDNRASNAEQRYMEGIENVLNYDADTMKKYLRGEDEG